MSTNTPQKRPPGYLAGNKKVNLIVALVGLVWAYLEWISGSLFWCLCALFLVILSVFNLMVKWEKPDDEKSNLTSE